MMETAVTGSAVCVNATANHHSLLPSCMSTCIVCVMGNSAVPVAVAIISSDDVSVLSADTVAAGVAVAVSLSLSLSP